MIQKQQFSLLYLAQLVEGNEVIARCLFLKQTSIYENFKT